MAPAASWRTIGLPSASCQGNYGQRPPRLPASRKKKKNLYNGCVSDSTTRRALYCILLSSPGKERKDKKQPSVAFSSLRVCKLRNTSKHTRTHTRDELQLGPVFSSHRIFSSVLLLPVVTVAANSQYSLCAVRVLDTPFVSPSRPFARFLAWPKSWLSFCYYTFIPLSYNFFIKVGTPLVFPSSFPSAFDSWSLVIGASSCHREDGPVLLPSTLAIKRAPPPIHSPYN